MQVLTHSVDETRTVAEQLGRALLRPGDVVAMVGDLGSGKTTFAQGVARGLDVDDVVVSPTFTIVRQYEGRVPFVHMDVYRLDRLQELHDLGFEEFLDGAVTVIEWGDAMAALLPADRLEVRIDTVGDDQREIRFAPHGASWTARAGGLVDLLAPFEARV